MLSAQAEHEANIHALETKHSDAIAKAQTELETLTAQNAAAADKALAQHEADVHALMTRMLSSHSVRPQFVLTQTSARLRLS